MRIGSLFSGYGGLDLAVGTVLGGEVAWHSEVDPGACKVLEQAAEALRILLARTTLERAA